MRHKRSNQKGPDPALVAALRRLRHDHDWTQEGLAIEAGLTIAALSRIERGLTDPAWSSVRAIATALGMSLEEFGASVGQEERSMRGAEA
jgi:transcriptional regulator with XRE-family HTH domain